MDTCHICIINCTYFAGKFSLSSRKKEKGKQLSMPDVTLQGAIVWIVQVRWRHVKFVVHVVHDFFHPDLESEMSSIYT